METKSMKSAKDIEDVIVRAIKKLGYERK